MAGHVPRARDQVFTRALRAAISQSQTSRTAPCPPARVVTSPRRASASACASATAMPRPAAASMGASGVSSPTQAHSSSDTRRASRELAQRGELVVRALGDVADAELARAPRPRPRLAPGDDGDGDAGGRDLLDAVAVAHVEGLQQLALRAVVQPAVGEHAVHVEHQQPHAAQRRLSNRSSTLRSQHPGAQQVVHVERADQRARASTTGSAVMRCFSMRCAASAASSVGCTRLAGRGHDFAHRASCARRSRGRARGAGRRR